ncbi:tail protein X [Frateuria aurantia]|uniref:p2-like prophage tail protein X n=1 Tax=Frateuria aurantia (strain ATCC 33424 / DSM 6220 / KCTC 2777 / LMG 1558 / NBRC 3245 / NCIMB 13370) TaxID=767434 RepID=H8L2L0_FRAAD|nr:tail protein X [Frateuria aurantia]AFC85477.1 P2-like prophage tail protein X [Frateuria aurantia DSM 6220]
MATIYRTCDGDLLDMLCNQHYASLDGTVEAVLSANPGLASQAQPYAAGIQIMMPDIATPVETEVQLWD